MSDLKTPLVELLFALESLVPENVVREIRQQLVLCQSSSGPGLDFLRNPSMDHETVDTFYARMSRLRQEQPMRFAAINFRCVLSSLSSIFEHDKTEALSGPLLLLMIAALGQAEKALSKTCCHCPLDHATSHRKH